VEYNLAMKNIIKIVILLLLNACDSNSSSSDKPTSKLLFKSGFESGVYLDEAFSEGKDEGTWRQIVRGSDNDAFSWPIKLWGSKGEFQVLVSGSVDAKKYIENRIVDTLGHDDKPTKAMRSEVFKAEELWTQDPYILMDAKEKGDLYVKYWLKLPKNLAKVLGDGTKDDGWCTFFEWKTVKDYRVAVYIYNDKNNKPYWYVHGDNVADPDYSVYKEFWHKENRSLPVPEDDWFMVEFFWHRSTKNDGRFWWSVNGVVVADYHGATKISDPIDRIMLFTVYSEKYPLYQLVDDIEIWDGFPCGEGKSCY